MTHYDQDRALETKFANQVKAILGIAFLYQDEFEDLNKGTDFLVLKMKPFKVGVRLRRKTDRYDEWKDEFTIRWSRPMGTKTEIHKIQEGLVDYIFYGFIDESETKIISYFIGDLRVFNEYYKGPQCTIPNVPHDSDFAVWRIDDFPSHFIVKQYPKPCSGDVVKESLDISLDNI